MLRSLSLDVVKQLGQINRLGSRGRPTPERRVQEQRSFGRLIRRPTRSSSVKVQESWVPDIARMAESFLVASRDFRLDADENFSQSTDCYMG